MERLAHYDNFADANGIIAVYPDGIARGWNDGRMTRRIQRADVDDVAFFSAALDKLESEYSVDATRVYATGISNGGFMSFRLGCDLAARFAAVAPDAATLSVNLSTSCNMARPVPLLMDERHARSAGAVRRRTGCWRRRRNSFRIGQCESVGADE